MEVLEEHALYVIMIMLLIKICWHSIRYLIWLNQILWEVCSRCFGNVFTFGCRSNKLHTNSLRRWVAGQLKLW